MTQYKPEDVVNKVDQNTEQHKLAPKKVNISCKQDILSRKYFKMTWF